MGGARGMFVGSWSASVRLGMAMAVIAGTACAVAIADTESASAATAVFDPIPSTRLGGQSVYGRVVTDGAGTFHSVVREDGLNQQIVYRRSTDGGETWTIAGRFAGDSGGATRPWIAVDGAHVAIVFIGLWCEPAHPDICHEVPYLTTSENAGARWLSPLRLDTHAFGVQVAVDDDRVWVAWDRVGGAQLRGTRDEGVSWFVWEGYPAHDVSLDAADETMVLAFHAPPVAPSTTPSLGVVTAHGQFLNPMQTLALPAFLAPVAATADGTAHVLLVDQPVDPASAPPMVRVTSATGFGLFGAPIPVMAAGQSATIDATTGSVAVAVTDDTGTTWVSASSDKGAGFSSPIPVSSNAGANPITQSQVDIAFATPPQGRPLARFDWSVPDRYVDSNGNTLPDPANGSGNDTLDQLRVFANQVLTVTLDGCGSKASPGRTIAKYTWTVDGTVLDPAATPCRPAIEVDDDETVTVRLDVEDDIGTVSTIEQDVTPHDHLIVSIGDSVASGEGSPHSGGTSSATWQDGPCHRSAYAGPALAARQLEVSDRRSSVTFIQLSCSGAAIVDVPEVAGTDDPKTGGLIDAYEGVSPAPGSLRPSQLDQMGALVGNRDVDALMVSIGANDVQFAAVVKGCITESSCDLSATRATFESKLATLPSRYQRLATAIAARGVAAGNVHLTEYFDPTSDSNGVTEMRCAVVPVGVSLLDDDEAIWARDGVITPLNAAGRQAALATGWRYVGGIRDSFLRHGYCAADGWVVQVGQSLAEQHDENGAFHPNRAGQRVYGAALFADLQTSLVIPAPNTSPGATGGPTALGDLMVITTTPDVITSVAVNMTGGIPIAGAVRRLDRLVLGDGLLFPGGPPAVDGAAGVAIWTELSGQGNFQMQTLAAQVAVRPNAAVRKVAIVQAPADGKKLVADRQSVVQATIDAMINGPETLDVTTTVIATMGDGSERELVPATTEQVMFKHGRNVVLLPVASTFAPVEGETVTAIVAVSDPIGAKASDDVDNLMSMSPTAGPEAVVTRPLRVIFGGADVGASSVSCQNVNGVAERMADYAAEAMPIDAAGIQVGLFCGLRPALTHDEPGVLNGLALLDEQARRTTSDIAVLVVPDGWLISAAGGAVGVAVPGLRAVILEANAPAETLSHEIAHVFGVEHTQGLVPAFGARVDTRVNRAGNDWMAPIAQPKAWTGGRTWDQLVTAIGGPANAPEPLDVDGPGVWVRGTVSLMDDGTWGVSMGQWLPAGAGSPTDPVVGDPLNITRMSVAQIDGNGDVVESDPVGLGGASGLYNANATPPADPFGYGFATLVTIDPSAVALSLLLDGDVVATVPVSDAPTVSVTSPVAGAHIPRGQPLAIEWTASDPAGDPLVASVLISDDDGATWRPLASGITGTTLTIPTPQDVGGAAVRVRVVVSDGLRSGEATSGAFSAEPDTSLGEDRVVFVRDLRDGATLP
ncbi:MAG TPA: hypothetical protein VFD53_05860, partial [Ilumatobacter sp.]|nr:hypothetical protein [Ilumatobacter sp.]